jgi:NADPH:quinone reductase-like Zn-dependent oxidoreductase
MKAACIHEFGGPEVLRYEDAAVPEPNEEQILIKVHAAGVNPVDAKIRSGKFKRYRPKLPAILGRDVSGVVVRAGSKAKDFKHEDAVFGMIDYHRGAYGEYCVALPSELSLKPSAVDHVHAAGIGVAGLTAWQALFDRGELHRGQRVLIHGGGGGVGHFAVQFAVAQGAEVFATASPKDMEFVRGLGAKHVINYKAQRFEEEVRDVDLVVDLVNGETLKRSWQVLKPGGLIVSTLGEPQPPSDAPAGARGREVVVSCKNDQLAEIALRAANGRLRIEVGQVYPLAEAQQAHEHVENGHSHGKTILKVSG